MRKRPENSWRQAKELTRQNERTIDQALSRTPFLKMERQTDSTSSTKSEIREELPTILPELPLWHNWARCLDGPLVWTHCVLRDACSGRRRFRESFARRTRRPGAFCP